MDHIYFRVDGGAVLDLHNKAVAERVARQKNLDEVSAKYGAIGCYGSSSGIIGLEFAEAPDQRGQIVLKFLHPEGWRKVRRVSGVFCPPTGKKGKEARDDLRSIKMFTGQDYHGMISPRDSFGYFGGGSGRGGFSIHWITYEMLGDTVILRVPDTDGGKKWTPPDDKCVRLKASEYWAMKESLVEMEAKAA